MKIGASARKDTQLQQSTLQNNVKGSLRGYSFSLSNIPGNLCKIGLPAMMLFALMNLPEADGGPLSYSACVLGCTTVAPPLFPMCVSMCLAALFLPTP